MSLNTIRAILIINAKKASKKGMGKTKGWTDEARAKAALTRKAKAKVKRDEIKELKKDPLVKKSLDHMKSLMGGLNTIRHKGQGTAKGAYKAKKKVKNEKVFDRSSLLLSDKASKAAGKAQAKKDRSRILSKAKTKMGTKSARILREMMDVDPASLDESKRTPDRSPKDFYSMRFN